MSAYTGEEKYIFVSYAHEDKDRVQPFIENMQIAGFRVSYHAEADEEWSFSIDEKLEKSAAVLVFISPNTVDSQNARKDINYVLENHKELLIIYLKDINSQYGLGKQLNDLPSLHQSQYLSEISLLNEILKAPILKNCRNGISGSFSAEKAKREKNLNEQKSFCQEYKVGDTVRFGSYQQNGTQKEVIEWKVLDIKDGKALLLSKAALDCQKYNKTHVDVAWKNCSLRKWLNHEFLNAAFSESEKAKIPTVTVSDDSSYGTNSGDTSRDQIFLLSVSEAKKYLKSNSEKLCQPTVFTNSKGVVITGGNCRWWLRSSRDYSNACYISSDGTVYENGTNVDNGFNTVRPALWMNLNGSGSNAEPTEKKDFSASVPSAQSLIEKKKLQKQCKVGSTVKFGAYPQNGPEKEDIEWQVLEVIGGKALLISKYALECKRYHEKTENITWENCTLRKWLNHEFLNAAFSESEKAKIPTVTVSADKNPSGNTYPGKPTHDKIFLLSIPEANQYFAGNTARICQPTAAAKGNGVWTNTEGNCFWWLRSPGNTQDYAADIYSLGGVREKGDYVSCGNSAVRPALWMDLNV